MRYVQSAYELRRVLSLARTREKSFEVLYTRLPASLKSIDEWRAFDGLQVMYSWSPSAERCVVMDPSLINDEEDDESSTALNSTACSSDEIALQPAPPSWLQKLLLPYPIPIYNGDDINEPYCST